MAKAVLFDFDGTLADSSPGIYHTALYTVRKLGIDREYTDEDLRKFIGPPLRMCFSVAFGLDERLLDTAVRIYREEYRRRGMHMMQLYPGIEELLRRLKGEGYKLAVATFKGEELVRKCLGNLGILPLFDAVSGSNEVETRTKSDIICLALDHMGVDGSEAVMVGDTPTDMAGAEGAGTGFIGVGYGFGFRKGEGYADSPSGIYSALHPEGVDMIEKIETKNAPAAIGPYSQAVKAGGMVFASGQIPIDPATGSVVEGSAADQAKQVFRNINEVLKAAGTDITKVVKATVFLKSMDDFGAVNEVYADAFKASPVLPARSAVQVGKLPKDVQVEIEVIALV